MNRCASTMFALATVAALALQGCGDAVRPLSPTPSMSVATAETTPLVPRIIAPQTTDPDIDWIPAVRPQFNHHYVWLDPSRPHKPKLLLMLPGATGKPRGHQLIEQEAARLGYYVIGLMYQNEPTFAGCAGSSDLDCAGNIRLEILDGLDRSSFVNVNPANSIDNRLTKLLVYLQTHFPDEGWSTFLKDGAPEWSQIAVAGHSLGASQAALIGKVRLVNRVVLISPGPEGAVAWVSIGRTPAAKYFALYHQHETQPAVIVANVTALDMQRFGDPVAPELSEPPYHGTHLLATDLEPQGGTGPSIAHLSTAVDLFTPLAPDGTPLLRDAWRYMLGDHETVVAQVAAGIPR